VLPDGSAVYLPTTDGVVVIDTATSTVQSRIPVEGTTSAVVLPDGSAGYAASYGDPLS
jgi:DNA-binding beta-propeller fold protein YncE